MIITYLKKSLLFLCEIVNPLRNIFSSLPKMHKKKEKVKKLLEITKDNINSVLLEMKSNKELYKINIKILIIFLIKNYNNVDEIYCKLKILENPDSDERIEEDIVDVSAKTIIKLLDKNKRPQKLFMLEYILNLDYFSRMFSIWYFDNKSLSYEENSLYSGELIKIIHDICKMDYEDIDSESYESNDNIEENCNKNESNNNLSDIKESFNNISDKQKSNNNSSDNQKSNKSESDIIESNKSESDIIDPNNNNSDIRDSNNKDFNESDNIDLIDLDDSVEIERLNKQLGAVFSDKISLTKYEKQKIAKICDTLEQIILKNTYFKPKYYLQILKIIDVDELLYKKIFKVIKNSNSDDVFTEALDNYSNIWRNINYIIEIIGLEKVLQCTINPESTLEYLDRSLVKKEDFYEYILNNEVDLEPIETLLIHCLKKENNQKILNQLESRIIEIDKESKIIEYISLKKIKQ